MPRRGDASGDVRSVLLTVCRQLDRCCGRVMGNCLPLGADRGDTDEQYLAAAEHTEHGQQASVRRSSVRSADSSRQAPPPYVQRTSRQQRSRDSDNGQAAAMAATARRAQLIAQLPVDEYTADSGKPGCPSECIICMGELCVGDKLRYLPCMHSFHVACIDEWLLKKLLCPSCMEPVDAALLSSLYVSPMHGDQRSPHGGGAGDAQTGADLFAGVGSSYGKTDPAKLSKVHPEKTLDGPSESHADYTNEASTSHQE